MKVPLLISILTVQFTLCNGIRAAQVDIANANERALSLAIGDTVSELGDSLWIVFQDSNNNYWFGTNDRGVFRCDGKYGIRFTTKDGLSNDTVRQIEEDASGIVYFATYGGICKFDGQTFGTLSPMEKDSTANQWKLEPDDMWFVGAQDAGVVYRYDGISLHCLEFPKTKLGEEYSLRFPRSKHPNATYSPYDVYCILKDSKGNVWFGTSNLGVCRYDGRSFFWISEKGLAASPVRSIIEDDQGNMWFGNSDLAVYRYDGKDLTDYRKKKGIGNVEGLPEDFPVSYMSMAKDNNGGIWIATYSCGVWRYDGERVTHYTVKDGDREVTVYSMYKDRLGDLWLGTHDAGAFKFNGKTFERVRF